MPRTAPQRTPWQLFACMTASGSALARPEGDACIELGALAYNDWTLAASGGSGLPAGESNVEYLRCVSCHGWDRLGLNGGYVRRERTAEHPNAGLGDLNTTSRDIAPGLGNYYEIDVDDILHEGQGRAYEDGSGSWVALDSSPTPDNIAAYMEGYSLGNLHPDFSTTGVNGDDVVLTQDQVECLVEFINYADADPKFYFQAIYEDSNPVKYVINSGASAAAGETFYDDNCLRCHGSEVYTRADRRVTSLPGLHKQVRRCEQMLGLTWFDDDIDNVSGYLNKHYYKFDTK